MIGKPQDANQGAVNTLDTNAVRGFHDRLDEVISTQDPLDEARALAELQHAISARLARLAVTAHEHQQTRDLPRGITDRDTTRLVGSQIGFARRCPGGHGEAFLHLAHVLVDDMPHTLAALATGVIGEWDATRIVREVTGLTRTDRTRVDATISDQLGRVAANRLVTAARAAAFAVDPDGARTRRIQAQSQRRVTLRPAPDCMAYLTAFLPAKDALACKTALDHAATEAAKKTSGGTGDSADTADPAGSCFARGQVMADALVERVTGRAAATGGTDLSVNLLMPLDTLTGDTPGHVPGYGPVPADLVREWFTTGDPTGPLVRRLFTQPGTGDIIGMESRARRYPGLLALMILLRDQVCRTPSCGAPILHTDHILAHACGGQTSERNGQGQCARCNYVKEHPDYDVTGTAAETTTTTGGFTTNSHPPAPPGLPPPTPSYIERTLIDTIWTHTMSLHDQNDDENDEDDDNDGDDQVS